MGPAICRISQSSIGWQPHATRVPQQVSFGGLILSEDRQNQLVNAVGADE